mmetsp:Transcript_8393/g.18641  ORF Transcript_8393/g.18641 Transcript_8393/m.18641 type:complete len:399 (-) Transcript_8393:94-1290(-)
MPSRGKARSLEVAILRVQGLGDPGQWQLWLSLVSRRDAAGTALGCRSSGWLEVRENACDLEFESPGLQSTFPLDEFAGAPEALVLDPSFIQTASLRVSLHKLNELATEEGSMAASEAVAAVEFPALPASPSAVALTACEPDCGEEDGDEDDSMERRPSEVSEMMASSSTRLIEILKRFPASSEDAQEPPVWEGWTPITRKADGGKRFVSDNCQVYMRLRVLTKVTRSKSKDRARDTSKQPLLSPMSACSTPTRRVLPLANLSTGAGSDECTTQEEQEVETALLNPAVVVRFAAMRAELAQSSPFAASPRKGKKGTGGKEIACAVGSGAAFATHQALQGERFADGVVGIGGTMDVEFTTLDGADEPRRALSCRVLVSCLCDLFQTSHRRRTLRHLQNPD